MSAVVTSSGYLDATVSTESETYYVEPAERYFAGNVSFPAVIYRASDVVQPHDDHDDCPSHRLYLKQFEESLARRRPTNQSSVINECPQRTGTSCGVPFNERGALTCGRMSASCR